MNISFKSGTGTATSDNVAMGVAIGPKLATVTTLDHVLKLRPMVYTPAWKTAAITVGRDIDISRFMVCNGSDRDQFDSTAFTLYVNSSSDSPGVLQISYKVELSHPIPFS